MLAARNSQILRTIALLIAVCLVGVAASAAASTYVFVPEQSKVVQTGGIAGVHWTYSVEGQFQLTIDPDAGTASFAHVDANATDDSPRRRSLDPNEVFNMTSLLGTVLDDTKISFTGKASDDSDVLITLTIQDDLAYLVGETVPPLNTADFFLFSLDAVAQRKYGGGTGEPNDPYQIATAEDLMLLGESPEDYDKHFILTNDIDLDPNLPGGRVFDKAVIAPDTNDVEPWSFRGTAFTGVFDGNGRTISHITVAGQDYLGLFGQLGSGAKISNLGLEAVDVNGTGDYIGCLVGENKGSIATSYSTGTVTGNRCVGGLVGASLYGSSITTSYSSGTVSGDWQVGGLVGSNGNSITSSYSTGTVTGNIHVGGLVGLNGGGDLGNGSITTSYSTGAISGTSGVGGLAGGNLFGGSITMSYSTGSVNGDSLVGGLVGETRRSVTTTSFWDMETSGRATSAGGTGLTTAEMQHINTYLNAGWDFINEITNGTCDYWEISPGDYPRLRYPVMPEGLGTAEQPYLIRDAQDLGTVWFKPMSHYRMEASVDLLGIRWSMAVVPWFEGTFDGNGYVISNLHIQGGGYLGLFGQLGSGAKISNLGLEVVEVNGIGSRVSGLVGVNDDGSITSSYSTGTVIGNDSVGGLVGFNTGRITRSYSMVTVIGNDCVGGLVGFNTGRITTSHSTGTVTGNQDFGGLVGYDYGSIAVSFWDMETSGVRLRGGGIAKTTAEMQTASTFTEAGWDFVGESVNGTEDIWWILEGRSYPRLWWQYGRAFSAHPPDGAIDLTQPLILSWIAGGSALHHDVYFGDDEQAVANATTETADIYRGRQTAEMTTYDPGALVLDKTYYWRIDEVNEADAESPWKGSVWSFTTANFIAVDDFEAYDDFCNRIFHTWLDGWGFSADPDCGVTAYPGNGTGSFVGCMSIIRWCDIAHGGMQSMPFVYDNTGTAGKARYSETERTWDAWQDWTREGVKALTLWLYGDPCNSPEPLYVALEDSMGKIKVVNHDDANAVQIPGWCEWNIDLREFSNAGVDQGSVKKMYIGVGNRVIPRAGGTGTIYIDDIRLYRSRCVPSLLKPDADLSGNCVVDLADIAILAGQWLQSGAGLTADLDADADVDLGDFARIADAWLKELLWP